MMKNPLGVIKITVKKGIDLKVCDTFSSDPYVLLVFGSQGRGFLKIKVQRGINLAVRDAASSDPYVVISMGSQKLKTRVIKKNCNPVWNDVLTLSVTDPKTPIKLTVFDKDTFTEDDRMGDAVIDIKPYLDCLQMGLGELPLGTAVRKVQPDAKNCLADESKVTWVGKGKMIQDMILKLRNVERGKVQIQLEWIDLPGCRGLRP